MRKTISTAWFQLKKTVFGEPAPKVAVIRLEGVIASGGGRFRSNLNLASVADQIEQAFTMQGVKAVALLVNSPGGSPVQSAMITDRIRAYADEKDIPVLAFAEDVAASGGYMISLAADEIYVNEASLVGSIGVISSGFGFQEAIKKIGVERRVYTAGESKSMLDSFADEKEEDIARLREIQDEIHEFFKSMVRKRRGKRLKGLRGKIFSGDVFTGNEAIKLGLVDGVGDVRSVMRDRFGDKVVLKVVGEKKSKFGALLGLKSGQISIDEIVTANRLGKVEDLPAGLISAVEERMWWNRFGL
ncbi:S49 family peptidase [Kordiimonas sp. SCSIO 12610]|uniref:S49 family peptidase n=1 Tax=Kordiimonas sp. SCSIO 12610 TaxID=2829597 RepID=UPI0021097194|nr:S49 family peptidase [Kordiimonas sp. SCSIO 12610]UTW56443.1 S49 family peptidase [Kordiimonas sp. SCSIO 12610]